MIENYKTDADYLEWIAERIKEYRLSMRLSQKDLAQKTGVSVATISHLEQGVNRNISLATFVAILRVLGLLEQLESFMPKLPLPPLALKKINKMIPQKVRRK